MPAIKEKPKAEESPVKQDLSATYNEFKEFEGKKYTGMKVGRSHRWHYDQGEWKETKVTPDKWEFTYAVKKRRGGKAPEGSGVPLGTEYHWYILAHQNVRKLDANTYTTAMAGLKYKLAHKRADAEKWSLSDRAQRQRLIQILEEMIIELKEGMGEGVLQFETPQDHPASRKRRLEPEARTRKQGELAASRGRMRVPQAAT